MSVELMLNAVNLSFIALARHAADQEGQVDRVFCPCVAAAEVAVGLAILISVWRKRGSMNVDALSALRG
jgi:NADH-quinone oxidoreductase subunit K